MVFDCLHIEALNSHISLMPASCKSKTKCIRYADFNCAALSSLTSPIIFSFQQLWKICKHLTWFGGNLQLFNNALEERHTHISFPPKSNPSTWTHCKLSACRQASETDTFTSKTSPCIIGCAGTLLPDPKTQDISWWVRLTCSYAAGRGHM